MTDKALAVGRVFCCGLVFWVLGVSFYLASFAVPVLESPEFQGNVVLLIVVPPVTLVADYLYYKNGLTTPGWLVGTCLFAVGGTMDALVTVPVFIAPAGGTYASFYSDPFFWTIGLEIIATTTLFWASRVAPGTPSSEYTKLNAPSAPSSK